MRSCSWSQGAYVSSTVYTWRVKVCPSSLGTSQLKDKKWTTSCILWRGFLICGEVMRSPSHSHYAGINTMASKVWNFSTNRVYFMSKVSVLNSSWFFFKRKERVVKLPFKQMHKFLKATICSNNKVEGGSAPAVNVLMSSCREKTGWPSWAPQCGHMLPSN